MPDLTPVRLIHLFSSALVTAACAAPRPAEAPASANAEPASEAAVEEAPAPESGTPTAGASAPPQAPEPTAPSDTRGKEEIQRVIADNRAKVRACYDAALKTNPGIKGDLVIGFVIDPEGNVKTAEINWSESELHVPELDTCAVDAVKTFKFPPSSRGLESKVNYPFNFNPAPPEPPAPKR